MPKLYHHPLCGHSRFVRLLLGEYGVESDLIEERPFERREDYLLMDPAGRVPLMVGEDGSVVAGAGVLAEFFDELIGERQGDRRLMPDDVMGRVEVRRLLDWFNTKFHEEVSGPLVHEKVYRRYMTGEGAGGLDMDVVRVARNNIRPHLRYIGYLIGERNWLAGDRMSYADLAAAAHLSSVDFLGDVPWGEDETAKNWYARVKSRPCFRPLLADRLPGLSPPDHYADLDF